MSLRATVLKVLPALSLHFSLTPRDVWALGWDEFDAYVGALRQLEAAMTSETGDSGDGA